MPGFKDWVNLAVLTEADLDDYVGKQVVMKFATSAARDAALAAVLREGMLTWQDDSNSFTVYTGLAWSTVGPVHGAFTVWSPAVVQLGAVTATTTYSVFQRIGRRVEFWTRCDITGAGTAANVVTITLPVAARFAAQHFIGEGSITDASATFQYPGLLFMVSATTCDLRTTGGNLADPRLGVTSFAAALAAGDAVFAHGSYEAAGE